jgi:hypothetical protein
MNNWLEQIAETKRMNELTTTFNQAYLSCRWFEASNDQQRVISKLQWAPEMRIHEADHLAETKYGLLEGGPWHEQWLLRFVMAQGISFLMAMLLPVTTNGLLKGVEIGSRCSHDNDDSERSDNCLLEYWSRTMNGSFIVSTTGTAGFNR